jgi:hypothetical protein
VPEGQALACKEETETGSADPQSTGAVDATADTPPPPEAKPAKVEDKAEPKPKLKTKTAKKRSRSLRREVERLFSAPGKYLSGQ